MQYTEEALLNESAFSLQMGHKTNGKKRFLSFYYYVRANNTCIIKKMDKSNAKGSKEFHVKY